MSNKISTAAAASGTEMNLRPPAVDIPSPPPERRPPANEAIDYRLVIEEDEASGSFVYKTLDRRTGEVVSQFPREQMLRLAQELKYEAGKVISTKA